ncbi:zinc-dependent peptidase [Massilia sp. DWR3-1-1]|uniref:M90 family metallopeptidase n=1 Tax=Massilia sp. DWR3-1-1 TaxID=2804559 RepID=UPI003CF20E68
MEMLIWTTVAGLLIGAVLLVPRWRRRRALAAPLAPGRVAMLAHSLPIYDRLGAELQGQLQRLVQQFLYDKKFVGCDGLEVDDDMRVTIAGQACLLLLNRFTRVYPALHTILVYPGAFLVPRNVVDGAGVVTATRQDLLGESWGDGRVVLAWDHVRRGGADWHDGQNVVLHEFAHQLDSESGSTNGAPYLGSQSSYRNWSQVLSRDFAALRADAMLRQHSVMDHYGATSPAEFFAVATETFFEKPWQMAERHPALYGEFGKYYRVDPRQWQDAPLAHGDSDAPASHGDPGARYGNWR